MSNADSNNGQAKGFSCPACSNRILISLEAFLSSSEVRCPTCSLVLHMDKSRCGPLVEKLQELHVASENVRRLQSR